MIDPTKPVFLKKGVVDPKSGNTYIPLKNRPYLPGELPQHLITDVNCYQAPDVEDIEPQPVTVTAERKLQPSPEYLASQIPEKTLEPEKPEEKSKSTTKKAKFDSNETTASA